MPELIDRDQEHLRLAQLAFYVLAGVSAFISVFGLFYIGLGWMMTSGAFPTNGRTNADPRAVGLIFAVMGTAFFVIGLTVAALTFYAGRSLKARRRRTLCMVMAGLHCLQIPWAPLWAYASSWC